MIKPKYNIGDKVWILEEGKAVQKIVMGVVIVDNGKKVGYCLEELKETWYTHFYPHEPKLFETKEKLIKSILNSL